MTFLFKNYLFLLFMLLIDWETNAAEHYEKTRFDLYKDDIFPVLTLTCVLMDNICPCWYTFRIVYYDVDQLYTGFVRCFNAILIGAKLLLTPLHWPWKRNSGGEKHKIVLIKYIQMWSIRKVCMLYRKCVRLVTNTISLYKLTNVLFIFS